MLKALSTLQRAAVFSALSLLHLPFTISTAQAQLADPDAEKVIAKRGDAVTTIKSIDIMLSKVPADQRAALVASRARMQQLIEASLLTQQLASKGRELKLDQDPVVMARMQTAANEILGEVTIERVINDAPKRDFEKVAKEYYLANPKEFAVPVGFKVQHVLISKEGRTPEQVKSLADEVLAKAKAGENFDQLVNDYSDDPSKVDNKGVFTVAKPGEMVEEFDKAARAFTKAGEFAAPITTIFGVHIMKYLDRTPAGSKPFDEVKKDLMAKYEGEYRDETRRKFLSDLRAQNPFVDEEVMDHLRVRYGLQSELPPAEPAASTTSESK